MTSVDELGARVASRYEALGLPAWPSPRPRGALPKEEEYSRVTDPSRYGITHQRARAWAAELGALAGTRLETLGPGARNDSRFDRGVRITPGRADGLPLLLLEQDIAADANQEPLAVLSIAVARPEIVVAREPDCGCDACDSGSDDLLEAIDEPIRRVVSGPYVVLRGSSWQAAWHPDGGKASNLGHGEFRPLMERCRRLADGEQVQLPPGTEVLVGRSWFG
jgi:hypothetical protein